MKMPLPVYVGKVLQTILISRARRAGLAMLGGAIAGVCISFRSPLSSAAALSGVVATTIYLVITAVALERAVQLSALSIQREIAGLARLTSEAPEGSLPRTLPPLGGWRLGVDALAAYLRAIELRGGGTVVELGAGSSTEAVARAAHRLGVNRLVAVEHDVVYARELIAQLADTCVEVLLAPLEVVALRSGESFMWYASGALLELDSSIDVLLVDGPPASTGSMARYPALPLLAPFLSPGALIIVDDADRPEEREIVRRWLAELDSLLLVEDAHEYVVFRWVAPGATEVEQPLGTPADAGG